MNFWIFNFKNTILKPIRVMNNFEFYRSLIISDFFWVTNF
jgi:hypothetical protein